MLSAWIPFQTTAPSLCTINVVTGCVSSSQFPQQYLNDDACLITVLEGGTVSSTAFTTESGFDELTINGVAYSGVTGPVDVPVDANDKIEWVSDSQTKATGWEVCLKPYLVICAS